MTISSRLHKPTEIIIKKTLLSGRQFAKTDSRDIGLFSGTSRKILSFFPANGAKKLRLFERGTSEFRNFGVMSAGKTKILRKKWKEIARYPGSQLSYRTVVIYFENRDVFIKSQKYCLCRQIVD